MGKPAWSEEEEARLRSGIEGGETVEEIAPDLPLRTVHGCYLKAEKLGFKLSRGVPLTAARVLTREVASGPEYTVFAAQESADEPIEELLDRTLKRTARAVQKARSLPYALARLVTPKPIGIAFVSDQHLSASSATDVQRALEDAELIQRTPGLYCVLGGDGIDNHIKHRRALVNGDSKPKDEWLLYNHYLSVLGYKTLAMVSGNHDEWSVMFSGIDMVGHLAKMQKVHYAPDEVVLTVKLIADPDAVDGQEYVLKVRHKYRFNSTLNLLHTVKRMYDMGGDPFDVGVVCHHHEAAFETFERHGQTRYAFRPGSYQIGSSYSRAEGYNRAFPTCPTVVLSPGERKIVPFQELGDAVTYLEAVRS